MVNNWLYIYCSSVQGQQTPCKYCLFGFCEHHVCFAILAVFAMFAMIAMFFVFAMTVVFVVSTMIAMFPMFVCCVSYD